MNPTSGTAGKPLRIAIDGRDNVAIVVNAGGLPAGTAFEDGLTLVEAVPQGHKVAIADIAEGEAVVGSVGPVQRARALQPRAGALSGRPRFGIARSSGAGPVRGVSICPRADFACPRCGQMESTSATHAWLVTTENRGLP